MSWGAERRRLAASNGPEGLYLELLKRCLTRAIVADELVPAVPRREWKRKLWRLVEAQFDRRSLGLVRRAEFRFAERERGLDQPVDAETMVGLRRLDNLQACIEQSVADGVPGDLLETGVWRGGTVIFMRAVLEVLGVTDRVVWVADAFTERGPRPDPIQLEPRDRLVPAERIRENFARYGLLDDQVRFLDFVPGDASAEEPVAQLAVLRTDADARLPSGEVLRSLYPKVSAAGFVIVDDYGEAPACRAAVTDYRAEHHIAEPVQWVDHSCVFWRRGR
jgi:O-methyltransferase